MLSIVGATGVGQQNLCSLLAMPHHRYPEKTPLNVYLSVWRWQNFEYWSAFDKVMAKCTVGLSWLTVVNCPHWPAFPQHRIQQWRSRKCAAEEWERWRHNSIRSSTESSGKSPTVTACGLANAPYFGGHWKYRRPSTLQGYINSEICGHTWGHTLRSIRPANSCLP